MFDISHLPDRTSKPRSNGLTMVMDKGLSLRGAEDLIETGRELVDLLKLGFGTSLVTPGIADKVKLYRDAGFDVYCGGTLFEAFHIRNELDKYLKFIDKLGIECLEVSDGSMVIPHDEKCELINRLSKDYKVLSEVGSKEEGILISPAKWIRMMSNELQAGSFKVIAEARESGNVGIYRPNGSAHVQLVRRILANVALEDILWEAPKKPQQVWFLRQFGANVNLGNIGPADLIPLECLRMGLRGDTFFEHLPEALAEGKRLVSDEVEED
ncbi:MAG: phosphosulfolactate synthase [Flavobacteriales bacterium]|jgi:phosphosulfolactate synthase